MATYTEITDTLPLMHEAWDAFWKIQYSGRDYPDFSSLLGDDWAFGLPINKTAEEYCNAAFDRMVAKYGEETF